MNVLSRECPSNMSGSPECGIPCRTCLNGGVCSNINGRCLCPPGFSGANCERVHGRNVFGWNAEYKCNADGNESNYGCRGAMVCHPDPLGCMCPAGFYGIDCNTECPEGKFGSNCAQDCHCGGSDSSCERDTGVCNGECENGWQGENCQIKVCDIAAYGIYCEKDCFCTADDCSEVKDFCKRGCTETWVGEACDEDGSGRIGQLNYKEVNPGLNTTVACSVIKNPVVNGTDIVLEGLEGISSSSQINDRGYNVTKTWEVHLESAVNVSCYVTSLDERTTALLEPHELPRYTDTNVLSFSEVSFTSIRVSWPLWDENRDIGDGPIHEYWIQYRVKDTKNFTKIIVNGTSHQVTDLQVGTLYEFRIILVREGLNGDGAPSDPQSQWTSCDAPSEVKNASVSTMVPGQLKVNWNPPIDIDTDCLITSYSLTYQLIRHLACPDGVTGNVETVFTADTSYIIDGLTDYAEYDITLMAIARFNGSVSDLSGYTETDAPTGKPESVQVFIISSTELQYTWEAPSCDSRNGEIISYSYKLRNNGITVHADSTPSLIVTLNNLIPYTEYSFTVAARTETGSGPESTAVMGTTAQEVPGPVANLRVTQQTETTMTVEWDHPERPIGIIIKCEISHRILEKPYDSTFEAGTFDQPQEIAGHMYATVLTDLYPSTVYEIRLIAYTLVGRGEESIANGNTAAYSGLQPPEADIDDLTINGTSATIRLEPIEQVYATGYYIRLQQDGGARRRRDVDGVSTYYDDSTDYIAAYLPKTEQEQVFTIGDSKTYSGYYNAPLEADGDYEMYVGVGSRVQEDVSVAWDDPVLIEFPGGVPIGAIVGSIVGVLAFVIFVVLVVFFRRRSAADGDHENKKHRGHQNKGLELGAVADVSQARDDNNGYENNRKMSPNRNRPNSTHDYEDVSSTVNTSNTNDGHYTTKITPYQSMPPRKLPRLPPLVAKNIDRFSGEYEEPSRVAATSNCIKIKTLPTPLQNHTLSQEQSLSDEFKNLPKGQQYPWTVGQANEGIPACGVLPYDHSRVIIPHDGHDTSKSEYYNASYIKGDSVDFVACRGPNPRNAETFWRMVWSEKSDVIVNLSTLELCFRYWPPSVNNIETFDDITVIWHKQQTVGSQIVIRNIKLVKEDMVLEVSLCQFLGWPEDDVPAESMSVLSFINEIKAIKKTNKHPIVVHDRNGVGASGTFIALYRLVDSVTKNKEATKGTVNIFEIVRKMRRGRVDMINNENQYIFLYEVLTVALLCPKTAVTEKDVKETNINLTMKNIRNEFELLKVMEQFRAHLPRSVGREMENIRKNRYPGVIPLDSHRIVLKTPGLAGGTDYVNASSVDSAYCEGAFIMAQCPLPATVEDFWRMVYDYDCAAVICLNEMDPKNETIATYWPEGGKVQFGGIFVVNAVQPVSSTAYVKRAFSVTVRDREKVVPVDHYEIGAWPVASESMENFSNVNQIVEDIQPLLEAGKRILVHCLDGADRCGVFVAVVCEMSRLRASEPGNFFKTALQLKGQNPNILKTMEEYELCYHLIKKGVIENEHCYAELE